MNAATADGLDPGRGGTDVGLGSGVPADAADGRRMTKENLIQFSGIATERLPNAMLRGG